MKTQLLRLLILFLFAAGCKKDHANEPSPLPAPVSSLSFNLDYESDGKALRFDTLQYTNDAGYLYGVSTLKYYLSEISLIKQDSSKVQILDYLYIDAVLASKNSFTIYNMPEGSYIGISFNIGLDSLHNLTGTLPNTNEHNTMEWPEPMGGGYHFLKFEGHYIDTSATIGFAMHLGTNNCLVKAHPLYKPISINKSNGNTSLNLTMNLNEWFRNPSIYDFDMDGNFSMGNMMAMQKLKANGVDVFHFKN